MEEFITWLFNFGEHWPDLTSLVVGSIAGYLLTLAIERYFLPLPLDAQVKRRQQGLTFLICWVASAIASVLMWGAIDPTDSLGMRVSVSSVVGVIGFFGYPAVARAATAKQRTSASNTLPTILPRSAPRCGPLRNRALRFLIMPSQGFPRTFPRPGELGSFPRRFPPPGR